MRALRLSLPVLALVALVPMAHAVARLEVLPRDRVPNGDFSRPAARPVQALTVNPGESGWEAFGYGSAVDDGRVSPPDATLVSDPTERKVFRMGDATYRLLSPWIDLPSSAQLLSVHGRSEKVNSMMLVAVVGRDGISHSELTMRLDGNWSEQSVPVGDVAGSRVRLRFEPVTAANDRIFVGHISPPQTLVADWALLERGGTLDVSVRADTDGHYVAITPFDHSSAEMTLESGPFELVSRCSTVTFAARASQSGERLDVYLGVDADVRWLGPFLLDDSWQRLSMPTAGLGGSELRIIFRAAPAHEIDVRNVGVTHTCVN